MTVLVTAFRFLRSGFAISLLLAVGLVAACTRGDSKSVGKVENPQTWAPEKLTSVQGVPATEIEALILKKLD